MTEPVATSTVSDVPAARADDGVSEVLIAEERLQRRIGELGAELTRDYRGRDLLLVGVLKGAIFFMADLMRRIEIPCEVDFMAISSYGEGVDSS
jgi:hypoxanthine phosphoribosyltransferase